MFTHARTDFLLELVLELVRLVKLRAMARGDNQLGRVVAGGIASHDCRESGQAQEEEGAARKEGGDSREPGPPASSRRGHCWEQKLPVCLSVVVVVVVQGVLAVCGCTEGGSCWDMRKNERRSERREGRKSRHKETHA